MVTEVYFSEVFERGKELKRAEIVASELYPVYPLLIFIVADFTCELIHLFVTNPNLC